MRTLKLLALLMAGGLLMLPDAAIAKVNLGNSVTVGVHETVSKAVSIGEDVYVYGTVKDDAVSIGGDVIVESGGEVRGDAVSFAGDVIIRSGATVKGDVKSIGGNVKISPGAWVEGKSGNSNGYPFKHSGHFFRNGIKGIFKGLVFGPFMGLFGAMGFVIGFIVFSGKLMFSFAIASVITYLFPQKVSSMALFLKDEFPKAMLLGFVIMVLSPFFGLLLLITIIGIPLIPLFIVFMVLVSFVGSVGVALWIGRLIPEAEGRTMMVNVLLGVLVVGILKNIPILGFIVSIAFTAAALGVMLISHSHSRAVV